MITFELLDPRLRHYDLGFIPAFLSLDDPRSSRDQIGQAYVSGWSHMPGFILDHTSMRLKYPGDPAMSPLARVNIRDEWVYIYPSAWVLILSPNGDFEVARID